MVCQFDFKQHSVNIEIKRIGLGVGRYPILKDSDQLYLDENDWQQLNLTTWDKNIYISHTV